MNIGLVFGGPSVEHDISIITATQVYASIDKNKYNIIPIYYSKDKKFYLAKNLSSVKKFVGDIKLLQEISINRLGAKKIGKFSKIKKIDCVIGAFHGKNTEGGELAGFFETLGIPYTFNSVLGASIGQDKIIMKKVLESDQIDVLPFVGISNQEYSQHEKDVVNKIKKLEFPVIVKPSMLGSSIGIKIVYNEEDLRKALLTGFKYDNYIVVEKALENYREFNCAIIDNLLSNIEEVEVQNEIFTFDDKYKNKELKHILPAQISQELQERIYSLTTKVSQSLRNESIARVDYLYDELNDMLYVNEINTIPGALSYYLYESKGIYFDELINIIINNAMKRDYKKKQLLSYYKSSVLEQSNGKKIKK